MQVPTWLHRRASSRICHETIPRVDKEKILRKQSDKGWSSIQESSRNLVFLPYPTDKEQFCEKVGSSLVIFLHGLLQEALGPEIVQQLLARPWILLITFTHKDNCSKRNVHNQLPRRTRFLCLTHLNVKPPNFMAWQRYRIWCYEFSLPSHCSTENSLNKLVSCNLLWPYIPSDSKLQ